MVSTAKDPLTFNELMATSIDFSKYAMNRLKIDNLTQAHLVGPIYEMLKGTCTRSIKLEYNMEECFKTLTDKLDWSNPEGDHCPFDLTKLLPLKGRPGRLTVAAEYNHDLEFLKSSDLEKKYNKDAENGSSTRVKTSALKLHGHGHLEEIVVRRDDRYLYKFKEDMNQDSAHMVAASKVPMLKPGKYEIWRMRIEQYIKMIDYALWKVIENGATLPKAQVVKGVMTEMPITTAKENA
nr:hypothetical protein [Tanacetum cinerariifolium]